MGIIKLAQELIAIPSVSGDEEKALHMIETWFQDKAFDSVMRSDRFVCARINGHHNGATHRAVILCGHVDTVSPGDEGAWTYGPWVSKIKGDRLYGLGSGDMKAGMALQMMVALEYKEHLRDFDLWVVAVADEEVSGAGSAAFADYFIRETSYNETYCMIAEPTDPGMVEIGHRGNRFVQLTFSGEAGHASQESSYQRSALFSAVTFLDDLSDIRAELHSRYSHSVMGEPSLTPTRIGHGGTYSVNRTSDLTTVSVDIRTTQSLDDDFDVWICSLADKYGFSWGYEAPSVPSALCAESARILKVAKQCLGVEQGTISHGATDQAFFQEKGIDTIVLGPGDFARAHTRDESVSLKRIEEARDTYMQIISEI